MSQPTDTQVASVPIFSRIAPDDLALVAAVAQLRAYAPGERVFEEGEPANVLLTILSGAVRVTASAGQVTDLPDVLHPGDPLGDVGAFEGGPYPATGTATEPTECLIIPRADFFRLLEQNPTLVRGFVHGLTFRLVQLTRELRRRS